MFQKQTKENGYFDLNRKEQWINIFYEWLENSLKENFYSNPIVKAEIEKILPSIHSGRISPYQAGVKVLEKVLK
jgi:LAO/AO transport system kinase